MIKSFPQNFFYLTICIVLLFVCSNCTDRQITELRNKAIKDSSELQELDKVCTQIPLPSDFRLIQKSGIDDQKISLSWYYDSQTKREEFWKLMSNYFVQNNWKLVKDIEGVISSIKIVEFTNDDYRVVIQNGGMRDVEYSIYCEKLK